VLNLLRPKFDRGEQVIGTWCMIPSSVTVDIITKQNTLDFVIIDMEHGVMSYETAQQMVMAAEANRCQPIVRIKETNDPRPHILHALEIGSNFVLIPHVSSILETKNLVHLAKYYPEGGRGLSPYTRNHQYNPEKFCYKCSNKQVMVGILIEDLVVMHTSIETIAATPGLDVIYFGLYDISISAGFKGEVPFLGLDDYLKRSLQYIKDNGKTAGIFCKDTNSLIKYRDMGFNFLAYSVDCYALTARYNSETSFLSTVLPQTPKKEHEDAGK
jgi:4-hydroxy-2-oxoheptanedioate aldolase